MWMLGAVTDLAVMFLIGPALCLALLIGMEGPLPPLLGPFLFAVLIDLPHQVQTHLLLLSSPQDRRHHHRTYLVGLVTITGLALACAALDAVWLVASTWAYWQLYHVAMQHFGVATLYVRRGGSPASTAPIRWVVLLSYACPILYRLATTGLTFHAPLSQTRIFTPYVPVCVAFLAYGLLFAALGWLTSRLLRSGRPVPWPALTIVVVVLLLYNLYFLIAQNLLAFIWIASSIHAMQYHLVLVPRARQALRSASLGAPADAPQRAISHALRRPLLWGGVTVFASVLLVAGGLLTAGLIPMIFGMHHFLLDGVLWRRPRTAAA